MKDTGVTKLQTYDKGRLGCRSFATSSEQGKITSAQQDNADGPTATPRFSH